MGIDKDSKRQCKPTENVEYLGRETIDVLNQKIQAHKFRYKNLKEETFCWMSDSGLVLKIADESFVTLLTSYQGAQL